MPIKMTYFYPKNRVNAQDKLSFLQILPLILLFLGTIVLNIRGFEDIKSSPLNWTVVHKVLALVFFVLSVLGYISITKKNIKLKSPALKLYFVYIVLGFFSLLRTDFLGYSAWKLFEVSAAFIMAMYIFNISWNKPQLALRYYDLLLKIILFLLASCILGIFLDPANAFMRPSSYHDAYLNYQLVGWLFNINSNSLGLMSGMIISISLLRVFSRKHYYNFGNRIFWLFVLITAVFLFIFSQ